MRAKLLHRIGKTHRSRRGELIAPLQLTEQGRRDVRNHLVALMIDDHLRTGDVSPARRGIHAALEKGIQYAFNNKQRQFRLHPR